MYGEAKKLSIEDCSFNLSLQEARVDWEFGATLTTQSLTVAAIIEKLNAFSLNCLDNLKFNVEFLDKEDDLRPLSLPATGIEYGMVKWVQNNGEPTRSFA